MDSIETAKSPSIIKAGLVFAVTAALLALSNRAPAQELGASPRAYTGEPSVRIRGADERGLTPVAFADWLAAHPRVRVARDGALFVRADADRNGWVSPVELKDFLMAQAKA